MHYCVNHLFTDILIDLLRKGERVRFRAPGSSMHPTIRNEEVIGVEPVNPSEIKRGDIILYQNGKGVIAHRVVRITKERPLRTLRSVSLKDRPASLEATQVTRYEDSGMSEGEKKGGVVNSVLSTHSSVVSSEPSVLSFEHSALSVQRSSLSSAPPGSRFEPSIFDPPSSIFILRGDASDTCDEPVEAAQILGRVVFVKRNGRTIDLDNPKSKMLRTAVLYAYRSKREIIKYIKAKGIVEKRKNRIMKSRINEAELSAVLSRQP